MTVSTEFSDIQVMWIDVIYRALQSSLLDINKGDMGYVISNMLAKLISSDKYYNITKNAADELERSFKLDLDKPIHIRKFVYGRDRKTILEHMVPMSIFRAELLKSDRERETIERLTKQAGRVTIMTRQEDAKLSKARLGRKMPEGWSFGDDPSKRYSDVGIEVFRTIEHTGPICR